MTYAKIWRRIVAYHVDFLIWLFIFECLRFLGTGNQYMAVAMTVPMGLSYYFYSLYFHMATGQTPGKRMLNIRVVRSNGEKMTISSSICRNMIFLVEITPWIIAFMIATSLVPKGLYYSLHGHAYNVLEKSFLPNWYMPVMSVMEFIVLIDSICMFATKKGQSLHDLIGDTVVIDNLTHHSSGMPNGAP